MVVDTRAEGELALGTPRRLFERAFAGKDGAAFWSFSLYDVTADGQRFVMMDEIESEPAATQLNLILNWAEELKRLAPTEN